MDIQGYRRGAVYLLCAVATLLWIISMLYSMYRVWNVLIPLQVKLHENQSRLANATQSLHPAASVRRYSLAEMEGNLVRVSGVPATVTAPPRPSVVVASPSISVQDQALILAKACAGTDLTEFTDVTERSGQTAAIPPGVTCGVPDYVLQVGQNLGLLIITALGALMGLSSVTSAATRTAVTEVSPRLPQSLAIGSGLVVLVLVLTVLFVGWCSQVVTSTEHLPGLLTSGAGQLIALLVIAVPTLGRQWHE